MSTTPDNSKLAIFSHQRMSSKLDKKENNKGIHIEIGGLLYLLSLTAALTDTD
ncbi:UNVERIFIED_CONTAM: hypothetical protein FKN15_008364 [Acipenser sinensis]